MPKRPTGEEGFGSKLFEARVEMAVKHAVQQPAGTFFRKMIIKEWDEEW